MTIDSNTLGWLISIAVALYIVFRFWKRTLKFLIFLGIAFFVLMVVQIKSAYDVVVNPEPKPVLQVKNEKSDKMKTKRYEVKAKYDTISETIKITDVQLSKDN